LGLESLAAGRLCFFSRPAWRACGNPTGKAGKEPEGGPFGQPKLEPDAEPEGAPDPARVRLLGLTESGLQLDVFVYIKTPDINE